MGSVLSAESDNVITSTPILRKRKRGKRQAFLFSLQNDDRHCSRMWVERTREKGKILALSPQT